MKSTFKLLTVTTALCAVLTTTGFAQSFVHETSDGYVWPTEPAVLQNLDKWQDQKFGVIFHWGYIRSLVSWSPGHLVRKIVNGFRVLIICPMMNTKGGIGD